jgi:hypothetical protein
MGWKKANWDRLIEVSWASGAATHAVVQLDFPRITALVGTPTAAVASTWFTSSGVM